jgi:hypothetical protein
VPWTPAPELSPSVAGTLSGTVFFTEARNAVALAKMTGNADTVESISRKLIRDARWRNMGEDEVDIVLSQIEDAASSVGLRAQGIADEVAAGIAKQAENVNCGLRNLLSGHPALLFSTKVISERNADTAPFFPAHINKMI